MTHKFRTVRVHIPSEVYGLMDDPQMADLMAILLTRETRYSAACWLESSNSWLGGPSPLSVLPERMADVIFAARRHVDPYNGGHG